MTVSTDTRRVQYATNGTTGPFTVTFPFLEASHLAVTYTDSAGVETVLVLNVGYTVSGDDVTTTTPYTAGGTITIDRSIPITQELDLRDGDEFPAESVERALDKLTMLSQQIAVDTNRVLRVPEVSASLPDLPAVADRASRLLGFDSSGNPIGVVPTAGDASSLALDLASSSVTTKGLGQLGFSPTTAYADTTKAGYFLREPVKRTAAEVSASVTPTFYFYLPLPKYDLRRCGVVMDGVTDDLVALNKVLSVITQQGGGTIIQGPGTLRITAAMASGVLPANLTWEGVGRDVSKIKIDGADVAMKRDYGTHTDINRFNLVVRNVNIFGGATALGGGLFTMCDHPYFENVRVSDFQATNAYGLKFLNNYWGKLSACQFENIDKNGVILDRAGGVGCNAWTINQATQFIGNNEPSFTALYLSGQEIEVCGGSDFSGVTNAPVGIEMQECEGVDIHHCYIERWTTSAIKANAGVGNTRINIWHNVLNSSGVPCLDFDNASSPNDRVTVAFNKFPDMGAGQTCFKPGATTNWEEFGNNPDTSNMTSTYTPSKKAVGTLQGTFTGTLTGVTGTVTGTFRYEVQGKLVTLYMPALIGTSNATTCTVTGLPTLITPTRQQVVLALQRDNTSSDFVSELRVETTSVLTLCRNIGSAGGFTSSNNKGLLGTTITYSLD